MQVGNASKAVPYFRQLGNDFSLPSLRFNTRPPGMKFVSTVNSFPANHEPRGVLQPGQARQNIVYTEIWLHQTLYFAYALSPLINTQRDQN